MLRFFSKQKQVTAGYQLKKPEFDNLFVSQQYVFTNRLTDTNYYDAALITLVAMME